MRIVINRITKINGVHTNLHEGELLPVFVSTDELNAYRKRLEREHSCFHPLLNSTIPAEISFYYKERPDNFGVMTVWKPRVKKMRV